MMKEMCIRDRVHNADRIRNMLNNRKIVGDEQVGQVIFIMQFFQQIDDLGLNGNVQ